MRPYSHADLFSLCIYSFIFLAVRGLRCCAGFSLVSTSWGFSPVVVQGLLTAVASLVGEHRFWSTPPSAVVGPSVVPCLGSRAQAIVVACGLNCSRACGIFPYKELNPCLPHWQGDSLPLNHQGGPSSADV